MRVCPLFQCRSYEALRLAVGPRSVRAGAFMLDAKLQASLTKFEGLVTSSIIRQNPLYLDEQSTPQEKAVKKAASQFGNGRLPN